MNSNEGIEAELGVGCASVIGGAGVEFKDRVTRLVPVAVLEGPDLGKAEDFRVRILDD